MDQIDESYRWKLPGTSYHEFHRSRHIGECTNVGRAKWTLIAISEPFISMDSLLRSDSLCPGIWLILWMAKRREKITYGLQKRWKLPLRNAFRATSLFEHLLLPSGMESISRKVSADNGSNQQIVTKYLWMPLILFGKTRKLFESALNARKPIQVVQRGLVLKSRCIWETKNSKLERK